MASKQQKTTYTAAEVAVLEETILKQKAEIDELKRKLEHINEAFANAQRARFGQSSEKNTYVLQEQTSLFNEAESSQNHRAEEPKPDTIFVEAHERKKKRIQAEMLKHLPEEEVLLEIPEEQRLCSKCGGKMKPIGKKFLRHEMQIIPKQIKLLAYYAVTYACDHCEKDTGFAHIISVKPPVPLMKHSLASPSIVAYIMTQKYVDGLPLARQEKIWAREGVSLSRATMANWVIQCSETWLKPLYRHMKQQYQINRFTSEVRQNKKSLRAFSKQTNKANSINLLISGVEGIGLGLVGCGIPDIPLFTSVILRSLYEISTNYGYDYTKPEEQLYQLLIIQGAMSYGNSLQQCFDTLDSYTQAVVIPTEEIIKDQIKATASSLADEMLFLKFIQGIPLV